MHKFKFKTSIISLKFDRFLNILARLNKPNPVFIKNFKYQSVSILKRCEK